MADFIQIPILNSTRLFEQSGLFAYQMIAEHEEPINYCQKFQLTDTLNLQFKAIGAEPHGATSDVTAFLVDKNNTIIQTLTVTKVLSTVISTYKTLWISKKLDTFTTPLTEGIYYVKIIIEKASTPTVTIYSEPIWVKTTWSNTILLTANNDINEFDIIFNTTNISNVQFDLRVEGGFGSDGWSPQAKDTFYKNQNYDQILLNSVPFETNKLTIGNAYGVPNYIAQIVNRFLSCNNFKVDGVQYTKADGAKLEPTRVDRLYPNAAYIVELMRTINSYSNEIGVVNNVLIGFDTNALGFDNIAIGI